MDDNKINPELGNAEETNEQEIQAEESVNAEEPANETSEEKTSEELVSESENEATTVILDGEDTAEEAVEESTEESVEESAEEAVEEKPKKKKGRVAVFVVLIALLLAATGAMVYYLLNSASKINVEQTVLTVGDVDSNAGEFAYAYNSYSYYASYYGFTEDQIKEYAIQELVTASSYYIKALEAGYTLDDEDNAEIEQYISSVKQSAETYSMTEDEYLESYFCAGYTVDMYREYLEKQMLAQKYYAAETEKINDMYNGDDAAVQAKYDADKASYDLSDVSYWYFDSTEEDAQTKADAIVAKVGEGMSFADAVKEVTDDSEAIPNEMKGHSKATLSNNFSSDAAEWIFSIEDGNYVNGVGAVTTIDVNSVIYVIYVNSEPYKDESVPVTVDYIQIDISTDTSVKSEEELKVAAKATATKILNEFESGTADADSFAELRDSYYYGDDELVSGDVFSEMVADGSHDSAVETWAFDSARKVGDYALVEGDGCYYILFYTAKNEHSVWYQTALDALVEEAFNNWNSEITAEFEEKTVIYDDEIEKVIAYFSSVA